MNISRFNVRVYGILVHKGRLLVSDEWINGARVVKFPGGGLEFGEGTIDCLQREWREEFDVEIEVTEHFYTTDYFQPSLFDNSQVISIYYFLRLVGMPDELTPRQQGDRVLWIPQQEVEAELFTLPIDRKVGGMLRELWQTGAP